MAGRLWLIVVGKNLDEVVKGLRIEPLRHSILRNGLLQSRAILPHKGLPAGQPPLLFHLRTEEGIATPDTAAESVGMGAVHSAHRALVDSQSLIHVPARRYDIDCLHARILMVHFGKCAHGRLLVIRHIIDVGEVGIKPALRTVPGQRNGQQHHQSHEPSLAVHIEVAQSAKEGCAFLLTDCGLNQVRKEKHHEEYRAQQQEGCE